MKKGQARTPAPMQALVHSDSRGFALLLGFGQCGSDVCEGGEMLVDISLGMLHRDRTLLIPPVRLRHHAAVDHAEPIMTPEIHVNRFPIAIGANLLGIKHQSSVDAGAGNVSLQAHLADNLAISIGEFLAELVNVRVVLASKNLAESGKPG